MKPAELMAKARRAQVSAQRLQEDNDGNHRPQEGEKRGQLTHGVPDVVGVRFEWGCYVDLLRSASRDGTIK